MARMLIHFMCRLAALKKSASNDFYAFKVPGTDQYFIVGHVSIDPVGADADDDTFVGVFISRPFDASDDEVKTDQLYQGGTDLELVSITEAQALRDSSTAFQEFTFNLGNPNQNEQVDWDDNIGTGSGPGSSNEAAYDNDIDFDLLAQSFPVIVSPDTEGSLTAGGEIVR